jgi:hypothetical protein
MVEVFKTNVQLEEEATTLAEKLSSNFPFIKINFDLEDCDKVLRVEGRDIAPHKIIEMLASDGYQCHILE